MQKICFARKLKLLVLVIFQVGFVLNLANIGFFFVFAMHLLLCEGKKVIIILKI